MPADVRADPKRQTEATIKITLTSWALHACADFIATPLPEVPADVRADPKHSFPHQTDAERRADMDVADEGESIPKMPGYIPHHDPNATADLNTPKCSIPLTHHGRLTC